MQFQWFYSDYLIQRFWLEWYGLVHVLNQLELLHIFEIDNGGTFELKGYENSNYSIYKVKKITCRSLKGKGNKSGLRLIYAFNQNPFQIFLLEIYYKGDKKNEDPSRIKNFLL